MLDTPSLSAQSHKLKVALFSFTSTENYGALLQSLGLQHTLRLAQIDSQYINFNIHNKPTSVKKALLHLLFQFVRRFFGYKTREKRTYKFKQKYLSISREYLTTDEIAHQLSKFDAFIVGSDQVWNPSFKDWFLLGYINSANKYSYAASIAIDKLPAALADKYRLALSKFKKIAVRENTGKKILDGIKVDSVVVLDPTLLLTATQWQSFFSQTPIIKEEYIFCYVMNGDNVSIEYIRKYANEINKRLRTNYPIYFIGDKEYKKFYPNYNLICNAGPEEFLNYLYNAKYVITNSFHGTCFSVNFKKCFKVVLRRANRFNSRLEDFLQSISSSDKIQYLEDTDVTYELNQIDSFAESELERLREHSLSYLESIVTDIKCTAQ